MDGRVEMCCFLESQEEASSDKRVKGMNECIIM